MRVAHVIIDVPTRALTTHYDYLVPEALASVGFGSAVLVDFAGRKAVGYVVGFGDAVEIGRLKPLLEVVGGPYFDEAAAETARWISKHYVCPLSEAVRLFLPPGGVARAVKDDHGGWQLMRAGVGPVDDRWVLPGPTKAEFVPRKNATTQRAILDALRAGPIRAAELSADLGSIDGALKTLESAGAVIIERRRRLRDLRIAEAPAPRHARLSSGQEAALEAIAAARVSGGDIIALDGVTGSGKTEVYLRAIEQVVNAGKGAIVLVPEISLTPQTVGRFRSRFGDDVAVLHSRLTPGERFDQWDRVSRGEARVVVGARSALFAPMPDLELIIIDEEHEPSYKQGSSPRYHARDVAESIARRKGATLVLGSASLSMETRDRCERGDYTLIGLPERVTGRPLPDVRVVDLGAEFTSGNRSMLSRDLVESLGQVRANSEKAVVFLNRRGFASFLLCRECGFVPACDACTTSMTYHEVGSRLMCHHCGATRAVPPTCPSCGSAYLRQFGAGTQRVEDELGKLFSDWPVIRMDADTTRGRGDHERLLSAFGRLPTGVLLGTQMIAKGLDFPEVTLVGVISADVTLNMPDYRAGERTYQLLEQVAGRAGRGERPGRVVVQTYWPEHRAIVAAAKHDAQLFYEAERSEREALGYPPYGALANVLVWGRDGARVARRASEVVEALGHFVPGGWVVLGPSPAPLSRLRGAWRWHVLVKAPRGAEIGLILAEALDSLDPDKDVTVTVDVDPLDLL